MATDFPAETRQDIQAGARSALIERTVAEAGDAVTHWLRIAQNEVALGRTEEARALLEAAAARFPDAAQVVNELANLADARGDWVEAERYWRVFTALSPTVWWGPTHVSHALCQQGRAGDAETTIREVLARFHDQVGVFLEHARVAETRKEVAEANARWAVVTERFPQVWEGWIGQAWALQRQGRVTQAEACLADAQALLPNEERLFTDHAVLAEMRQDWTEASARWAVVVERFPKISGGLTGQARMLRQRGQLEEAKVLLIRAAERFPTQPDPLVELARLAESALDWTAAERWWRDFVALKPNHWWGYTGLANALREQNRVSEAGAVLASQFGPLATEPIIFTEHARLAERARDWRQAEARWADIVARFPNLADGYTGRARSVSAQGDSRRLGEADNLYQQAHRAFTDVPNILYDWGMFRIQHRDHKFDRPLIEIELRISDFLQKNPSRADVLRCQAAIRRSVGDHQAAFRILTSAAKLFPKDRSLTFELALMQELLLDREVNDVTTEIPKYVFQLSDEPSMFSRFESLGGGGQQGDIFGYGCEFGLVQRNFGADPLGLLRWASIGPQNLIRALDCRFADVGDYNSVLITPQGNSWGATETNYDIIMAHTQLEQNHVPMDEAKKRVSGRMKFLARKLTEDLVIGEKIFVYRVLGGKLDDATLANLHNAVRTYGNSSLLYVTHSDKDNLPGTVRMLQPGLLIGFIEWFAPDRPGLPDNLLGWRKICEAALQMSPN